MHASDPTDGFHGGPFPSLLTLSPHPVFIPHTFPSIPFPSLSLQRKIALQTRAQTPSSWGAHPVDSSLCRRRVGSIAGPAQLLPSGHGGLDPRLGQGEDSLRTKPPGLGRGRL